MICTLTDGFDAATVERIQARLDEVERDHRVRVLWAVESGSRAWGFPSPDSDYDCRFFYVRRHDDYLSPWRPRDVIETPLDDVLDVNGWDLIKAIHPAAALHWTRTLGSPVPPMNLSALLEEAPRPRTSSTRSLPWSGPRRSPESSGRASSRSPSAGSCCTNSVW